MKLNIATLSVRGAHGGVHRLRLVGFAEADVLRRQIVENVTVFIVDDGNAIHLQVGAITGSPRPVRQRSPILLSV